MQHTPKNYFSLFLLCSASILLMYCSKQEVLSPVTEPPLPQVLTISFRQDTLPVSLAVTTARKENVGTLFTTAIEAKFPDSTNKKNNLIIRVTGDSARAYATTEIFATYTDSSGSMFSTATADTANKVILTKLQKKKGGLVEGSFTIRVSNSTKTKTYLLKEGKISSSFLDY